MMQAIKRHGIDRALVESVEKGSFIAITVLGWAVVAPHYGVPEFIAIAGVLLTTVGAFLWAGGNVLSFIGSRYEPWGNTSILPDQLQSPEVIGARSRCDPERECYHVLLDSDDMSLEYRRQWKDDWDVLGASSEHGRLRLVLLESWD